jgi:chromosome segregation ATPase
MSYLSRIETERDELRATVQHLLSGWNRMVDDIAALKKARDEYHDAIVPWKERAEQWASQHNEMENERNEWREKYEMAHADHATVTQMWSELKTENDLLKAANDSLMKHQRQAVDELEKVSEQYAELKKGRDVWKGRAEELQRELDSTTHSVMDLKVSNADLFSRLQRESGNVEHLAAQNIALEQQVALLEMALAECASDKALLEAKWQGVREVDKYHAEQDLEEEIARGVEKFAAAFANRKETDNG